MNSPALLELTGVTRQHSEDGPVVLRGIDLRISSGETLAIVGPSGSGKSTLLNIIGTLDRPTSGSVRLDGVDVTTLNEAQLARLRNRQIGFIFQDHHLLPQCTALENVLIPTLADGPKTQNAQQRAVEMLQHVGLGGRLRHLPGELSGGEKQRVATVRALINQPKLLLADEPTGSLDRASADALGDLLLELNQEQHVTLIVVTHAPHLAAKLGQMRELRHGRLVEPGGSA